MDKAAVLIIFMLIIITRGTTERMSRRLIRRRVSLIIELEVGGDGWYISLYSATRGHCQLLSPSELLPIGESAEEVYDTISA